MPPSHSDLICDDNHARPRAPARLRIAVFFVTLIGFMARFSSGQVTVPGQTQESQQHWQQVIGQTMPRVVAIAVFRSAADSPLPPLQELLQASFLPGEGGPLPARLGGGVLVSGNAEDRSGFILTSAQLLEPAIGDSQEDVVAGQGKTRIIVRTTQRTSHLATLHAVDAASGLGIVQITLTTGSTLQENVPLLTVGENTISPGMFTLTYKDPWEIARSGRPAVQLGVVSSSGNTREPLPRTDSRDEVLSAVIPWMNLDSNSAAGDIGTPIFASDGRLIGLTSSFGRFGPAQRRPQSCILGGVTTRVLESLLAGAEFEYGEFPFSIAPPVWTTKGNTAQLQHTVRVSKVWGNSSAARGGLQSGDEIREFNGKPVTGPGDLLQQGAFTPPGNRVSLRIFRPETGFDGTMEVVMGKWFPSSRQMNFSSAAPRWNRLGLVLDFPRPAWSHIDIPESSSIPEGVLVRNVRQGSPAAAAGLKVGLYIAKVGEQPVETPDEFEDALKYWSGRIPITLGDQREVFIETPP